MVCYSNKTKACCAKYVGCVSVVLFLLGLLVAIFGYLQMGINTPKVAFIKNLNIDQSGLGMGVLILGILILFTACCGCATCKWKKVCFTIPFGIFTAIFGLVLLIIGFLIVASVGPITDDIMTKVCAGVDGTSLSDEYNTAVSKFVCSQVCPCPIGDGTDKTMWESYGNGFFKPFGRMKNFNSMSPAEQSEYNNYGAYATVTPLVWTADSTETGYSNWADCYTKVLKPAIDAAGTSTNTDQDKITKFIQSGGLDFLKEVENQLSCASACSVPMAYATLDISLGKPETDCANALVDKLKSAAMPAGVVCIITSILLLTAMCGSFPLCTGFSEDMMDENDGK